MTEIEKMGEICVAPEYEDGARFLRLLGYGELIGQTIPEIALPWESFLDFCGDNARTFFVGLEHTDPESPQYAMMLETAKLFVRDHLEQQSVQPSS